MQEGRALSIPRTCLPIPHVTPVIPATPPVSGGYDWPVECPPEPYVDGCDCGCPRDPNLLFGPDSTVPISHDFIVGRSPVTLAAIGMPECAFATIQHGLLHCGCYVYDDWFRCGEVVRLSRSMNRMTIAQPGRYRLRLFNADPSKIYIKKVGAS